MPVTVAKSALAKTNVRYKPRKGRKDFTKNLLGCDLGCDLRCDLRRGDVPTGIAGARRGRVNAALNFHKHRVTRSPCRARKWAGVLEPGTLTSVAVLHYKADSDL